MAAHHHDSTASLPQATALRRPAVPLHKRSNDGDDGISIGRLCRGDAGDDKAVRNFLQLFFSNLNCCLSSPRQNELKLSSKQSLLLALNSSSPKLKRITWGSVEFTRSISLSLSLVF